MRLRAGVAFPVGNSDLRPVRKGGLWLSILAALVVCTAGCGKWSPHGGDGTSKLLNLIESKQFKTKTEVIDFVRNYIHRNSIHSIDDEYRRYWNDIPLILRMMYKHNSGTGPPPHLECYSRSLVMKSVLGRLNIGSRMIVVFSDNLSYAAMHTFLEVFNPDKGRWQVQDADYNLWYKDTSTNSRISAIRLVLGKLSAVTPCRDASTCGWKATNSGNLKRNFFEALAYDFRRVGKGVVVVVNTNRLSLDTRFPGNGGKTFREFIRDFFDDPVLILTKGTGE